MPTQKARIIYSITLVVICITLLVPFAGCSPKLYFNPNTAIKQTVTFNNRMKSISSHGTIIDAILSIPEVIIKPNAYPFFFLTVINKSNSHLDISVDNINMFCGSSPVRVLLAQEFYEAFEKSSDILRPSNTFGVDPSLIVIMSNEIKQYNKNRDAQLQLINQELLRPITLRPNQQILKLISCDNPGRCNNFIVKINVSGESHEFFLSSEPR